MDEQRTKRTNEAAQKFTDALIESYRAVSERSVEAQERQAQFTQSFFESVMNNARLSGAGTQGTGGFPSDGPRERASGSKPNRGQ